MSDESVCSVCSRLTGFGDEDKGEPPVNSHVESMADAYSTHEDVIDAVRRYEDALSQPMAAPR